VSQFKKKSLKPHEEQGKFVFKKKPCPFLKNNLCSNYSHRPLNPLSNAFSNALNRLEKGGRLGENRDGHEKMHFFLINVGKKGVQKILIL
jgi:hypothetical protein